MKIELKPGKERPIVQRHRWIYSGAVSSLPTFTDGSLAEVYSHQGVKLGTAMLRRGQSILGHMIAYGEEEVDTALRRNIRRALQLRSLWIDPQVTNAYRFIHAEADGLPGLIIDVYCGRLVMQISHPGMEKLKSRLLAILHEEMNPVAIFEKSTSFLRKQGGMEEIRAHLAGDPTSRVEIVEHGLRFCVDLLTGQKTGFFLDQREMRYFVQQHSRNRRVLNCFAYTGGFSVAACVGGALSVDSVEINRASVQGMADNLALNGDFSARHRAFQEDVFAFLAKQSELAYDLIILDPPAFVKKREDMARATRAYQELNWLALSKMAPHSFLLTSSCSYHVSEELFQKILFHAALAAQREVQILTTHRMAEDHPVSLFHPEGRYLKSVLLYVA